jgi:regulatory protein
VGGDRTQSDETREAPAGRDALALLARRPRTARELRDGLLGRGHDAAAVEQVVAALERSGHIDDVRLAAHWVVTRATRLGHGPRRLVESLVRRGVDRDVARVAWDRAVEQGDLDPAALIRRQIRRRVGAARSIDRRTYGRVYNALLRAGFGAAAVEAELAGLRQEDPASGQYEDHEVGDDFA